MNLKNIEIKGFKSFAKREQLTFNKRITAIVGPNGSGKSNIAEAFRFVLGEQSMKSMRSKKTEDLLFNGSSNLPRTNRASVSLTLDNSYREIDQVFDEIEIERVIHRDATNEYYINSSPVRLKDVIDILTRTKVGIAGHNIISQGEADKMLSMKPAELKAYIEQALGLTQYQLKKQESLKKLDKTNENLKSVQSLAREHAPHLHYLEREMSQLEKRNNLIAELKVEIEKYVRSFIPHNNKLISVSENNLKVASANLEKIKTDIKEDKGTDNSSTFDKKRADYRKKIQIVTGERETLKKRSGEIERAIGRLEAELEFSERLKSAPSDDKSSESKEELAKEKLSKIRKLLTESLRENNFAILKQNISRALNIINEDESLKNISDEESEAASQKILLIKNNLHNLIQDVAILSKKDDELASQKNELERNLSLTFQEEEKEKSLLKSMEFEKQSLEVKIKSLREKIESLKISQKRFFSLVEEVSLLARVNLTREDLTTEQGVEDISDSQLRDREKVVERLKLKIEGMQVGDGHDIKREYSAAKERADFLSREIADMEQTINKLREVASDLDVKIEKEFSEGISKITAYFSDFFSQMFVGGTSEISKVVIPKKTADKDNDHDKELYGVEVRVALPHKKLKSINMLSGGEKTLVSIALIFALSLVNPPPFLVLDETDAALDEANSRRYGKALSELSKYSQLILITHNRETMSQAGMLYGITMGKSATSELLSIDLEEAEKNSSLS